MPLSSLPTPHFPGAAQGKMQSCQEAQHPLPGTQPRSLGTGRIACVTWRRAQMHCGLSAPPPQHKACAGDGELPVVPPRPGCLLPSRSGATSNFPSWLRALP